MGCGNDPVAAAAGCATVLESGGRAALLCRRDQALFAGVDRRARAALEVGWLGPSE